MASSELSLLGLLSSPFVWRPMIALNMKSLEYEYLHEKDPTRLQEVPYDRAIARFWASYIDDKWFPSMLAILRGGEGKAAAIEQLESGLKLLEEAFKKCCKGNEFFGCESIGYLDTILGCHLGWLKVTEITNDLKVLDDEKTPLLSAWSERFCSDAIVKEIVPETEKLINLSK